MSTEQSFIATFPTSSLLAIWVRLGTRLAWDWDKGLLTSCLAMSSNVITSPVLEEPRVYIYLVS